MSSYPAAQRVGSLALTTHLSNQFFVFCLRVKPVRSLEHLD